MTTPQSFTRIAQIISENVSRQPNLSCHLQSISDLFIQSTYVRLNPLDCLYLDPDLPGWEDACKEVKPNKVISLRNWITEAKWWSKQAESIDNTPEVVDSICELFGVEPITTETRKYATYKAPSENLQKRLITNDPADPCLLEDLRKALTYVEEHEVLPGKYEFLRAVPYCTVREMFDLLMKQIPLLPGNLILDFCTLRW